MTERREVPAGEAKKLFSLKFAAKVGDEIVEVIADLCTAIEVFGSIRRKRPKVHDIDMALIPKPFLWSGTILNRLKKHFEAKGVDFYLHKAGPGMAQIWLDYDLCVDIWVATASNWGLIRLLKTGSALHNIKLSSIAKRQGKKITELPDMTTERAIFEELGLDYVPPEEREK